MKNYTNIKRYTPSNVDLSGVDLTYNEVEKLRKYQNEGYEIHNSQFDIMMPLMLITSIYSMAVFHLAASIPSIAMFLFLTIPIVAISSFVAIKKIKRFLLLKAYTANAVGIYHQLKENGVDEYYDTITHMLEGESKTFIDEWTAKQYHNDLYLKMVDNTCGFIYYDGNYNSIKKLKEIAPLTFKKWKLVLSAHSTGLFHQENKNQTYGKYKSFYDMVDVIDKDNTQI